MLEENMETILSEGYRKAMLRRFRVPNFRGFDFLLDNFDVTGDEIKEILERYTWKESKHDILEFLLKELVYRDTRNKLYSKSVHIDVSQINTPYDTYTRYTIKYTPKLCVLEEYTSEWIWKNHEEVCKFMDSTYNKLEGEFIDDD